MYLYIYAFNFLLVFFSLRTNSSRGEMSPTSYSINLPQILLSPAASEALSYYCQSHLAPALSPLLGRLPLAVAAVLAALHVTVATLPVTAAALPVAVVPVAVAVAVDPALVAAVAARAG